MAQTDADRQRLLDEIAELRARLRRLEAQEKSPRAHPGSRAAAVVDPAGALRRGETQAEAVLESASEGIIIVGMDGAIRAVNASAERLFGYRREELIGRPLEVLVPGRFRSQHATHRHGYFASPRVRPMGQGLDLAAVRKDGTEFPVEISLSFVDTEEGRLAMAFVTDITDRKQAEASLERQREALHRTEKLATLGTLAAGVAHEINNPIGIIASRIELILTELEGTSAPPALREDLEVIQRNVRRVAQIAHGLLSFAHQSPRERGPVDLRRVVDETLALFGRQLAKAGIDVRTTLAGDLPPVLGDAGALQQVVLNLLTNAREALSGGGTVSIEIRRAAAQPGWLQLIVADDGPGIPAHVVRRIFDPFFTTKVQGTGLGLSVTYGIVQDHGGTIEVHSEPGRGATFVVTLPAHGAADPSR
jgi:PAS domain S-box-containing protein